MNKPNDPISVRQARQGKPVFVILAVSMALAIIAGWVLWGVVAEDNNDAVTDGAPLTLQQSAPVSHATL
ncbi:MAG: hypothetical protein ACSHXI_21880 [Hoeflea sp.]|uniref:hypothetical protein n=1 Tax=Hoeflea sp. TaxID=1940281 RepID=UPI003EF8DB61